MVITHKYIVITLHRSHQSKQAVSSCTCSTNGISARIRYRGVWSEWVHRPARVEGACIPKPRVSACTACRFICTHANSVHIGCRRYAAAGRNRERLAQILPKNSVAQIEVPRRVALLCDCSRQRYASLPICIGLTQVIVAEIEDNDALLHMAQSTRCTALCCH